MKSDVVVKQIEKWSFDYIKMKCKGENCYGVLAVCPCSSFSTSMKADVLSGASDLFRPCPLPFSPQQLVDRGQGYTRQTSGNSEWVAFLAFSNLLPLTEM